MPTASDARRETYALTVLMHLRRTVPPGQDAIVKSSAIAETLRISRAAAVRALNDLEDRSMINVRERLPRGTRIISWVNRTCICLCDIT